LPFQPSRGLFTIGNFVEINQCATFIDMDPRASMLAYLEYLGSADIAGLRSLFAPNAKVLSPLYGELEATAFYDRLMEDTSASSLNLHHHWYDEKSRRGALFFAYGWDMANGQFAQFDVVDIIDFNHLGEIEKLQIIYDTEATRSAWKS